MVTTYGWVTEAEADTFMSTRYNASSFWISGVDKAAALQTAYHDLFNCKQFSLPVEAVDAMKNAQFEQALFLVQQAAGLDSRMGLQAMGVNKVGIIKEEFTIIDGIAITKRAIAFLTNAGNAGYFKGNSAFIADISREDDYTFDED